MPWNLESAIKKKTTICQQSTQHCLLAGILHFMHFLKNCITHGIFLFSLFCSLEKSSHAHSDQLLYREPVLRRHPGDNHMSSCKSSGGHYRNLVLWTDLVQDTTLLTGKETDNILTYNIFLFSFHRKPYASKWSFKMFWNICKLWHVRFCTSTTSDASDSTARGCLCFLSDCFALPSINHVNSLRTLKNLFFGIFFNWDALH